MDFHLQKTDNVEHLKANRISFRKKRDYDENMTAAENIKGRLNDLFVPSVKDDEFISDSESDTDSGEDYETREYPSWQRTLSLKHNKEKDPWPTQRKFGYSDKLKLEKRIKKICKVKNKIFLKYVYTYSFFIVISVKVYRLVKQEKSFPVVNVVLIFVSFKRLQRCFLTCHYML